MNLSTAVIKASDFYETGDNKDTRDGWKSGALRHVVAALAGSPVVLITDKQTGHAVIGAKLIGLSHSVGGGETLVYEFGDGSRSAALVFTLGSVIVPLESPQAKWDALDRFREEGVLAARIYHENAPELEGMGRTRTRSLGGAVHVSRFVTRQYSNGKGGYEEMADWGSVTLAQISAAAECGRCLQGRGRHTVSCKA